MKDDKIYIEHILQGIDRIRDINPQVPWSDMAGMRDILIHDYFDVDTDIVWKTASESIFELEELLQNLTWTK